MEDLVTAFALPADTKIIHEEKFAGNPNVGTKEGEKNKGAKTGPNPSGNHIYAAYEETYDEADIINNNVYGGGYIPIMRDDALGILLQPTYATVKLDINVKIRFRSKTQMNSVRRAMRLASSLSNLNYRHAVQYNYSLPETILLYLYDAYMLRNNVAGYGDSLAEWLDQSFIRGRISRTTADGKNATLAVDEVQDNIYGRYGTDVFYNEPETEDGNYEMSFQYLIEYKQILAVVFKYPNVIHNQDIDGFYNKAWNPPQHVGTPPTPDRDFATIPEQLKIPYRYVGDGGVRLDPTDDWFPKNAIPNYATLVIAPLLTDPEHIHQLFNIYDIEDVLPPGVLDYIVGGIAEAIEPYQSPYHMAVYRVGEDEIEVTLAVDNAGNVTSVLPMDLRKRYYLRVSYLTDFGRLTVAQTTHLRTNPDVCELAFRVIYPPVTLNTDGWLTTVRSGGIITVKSFRDSVKRLPGTNRIFKELTLRSDNLVQTTNIITRRL